MNRIHNTSFQLARTALVVVVLLNFKNINAQYLNAEQLLEASFKYHDPTQQWFHFNDTLIVEMTTPKQSPRKSTVVINLKADYYSLHAERNKISTTYIIDKKQCSLKLNGTTSFSDEDAKRHNLTCDYAFMMKDYYTYLYGLPMKIKDPGAIIQNTVKKINFKGKDYLMLQVSYTENVGDDVWFFYFNPQTFALEVYQFFKTDENRNLIKDSGEYILLSEETEISGIKMPKIRKWYYNKDDKFLGTDTLLN